MFALNFIYLSIKSKLGDFIIIKVYIFSTIFFNFFLKIPLH